jgi:hypothetical protein
MIKLEPEIEPEFIWAEARAIADELVLRATSQYLSDVEMKVLQASWEEKTYDDMAKLYGYSAEYLNKDVGNKLWRKLAIAMGERVTKKNFKEALRRSQTHSTQARKTGETTRDLPFPEGAVAMDSPLYTERAGVESLCYEAVLHPGALIRIKAPKLMGKTSLLNRILAYSANHNCQAVYLDLSSVDRSILTDLDKFLRWLCCMVGRQLKLENRLEDYWDTEILGSNDNCTAYFEEYLLAQINCPLVLGIDEVDRLFPFVHVIEDVFGMLRSWHEKGKITDRWKQLRLVLAHSTEAYIPLDINQSPFNAGIPVELAEFDNHQIQHLAQLQGLDWPATAVEALMQTVGGHPYLVRLALYHIAFGKVSLAKLLAAAATESGIYCDHLRRYLEILQQSPQLLEAFRAVVFAADSVELASIPMYKLHSMGLVQRQGNDVMPWCNLYRDYFCRVLTASPIGAPIGI